MSGELLGRLREAFSLESRDHLEKLRESLTHRNWEAAQRRLHTLKGASRAAQMPGVEKLTHLMEDVVKRCQSGELDDTPEQTPTLDQACGALEDMVAAYLGRRPLPELGDLQDRLESLTGNERAAPPRPSAEGIPTASSVRPSARVTTEELRGLLDAAQGLLVEAGQLSSMVAELTLLSRKVRPLRDFSRRLVQLNMRLQQRSQEISQRASRSVLAPASELLGWLGSTVRELAVTEGKRVRFELVGAEVAVEVPLLESLYAPLLHLLRNAVHHGLESEAERISAGKLGEGHIRLEVRLRSGWLFLTLEDDGRGLDLAGLRERAEALGISQPTPTQLVKLVLAGGISTAKDVNELAGRGVGMQAARSRVEELGGRIECLHPERPGTRWRLVLPAVLTAEPILLLRVSGQVLGLPGRAVASLHMVGHDDVLVSGEGRTVRIGDRQLPLTRLASKLGLVPAEGGRHVRVVALGETAIEVDDWITATSAVVRPLLDLPGGPYKHLVGTFVRDTGEVCLVLDPEWFQAAALEPTTTPAPETTRTPTRQVSVLVVDDSLTSRTLIQGLLKAHGYRVTTAADGQLALDQLRQEKFDLVISDVQMPNLDGLGLLTRVRQDPELRDLPVVLLTSLEGSEDQQLGLQLGADAYLLKQRFEMGDLLEVVRQLC